MKNMEKKIIFSESAPAAVGPYSQGVEMNGMLFLSGMLPIDPATGDLVSGGVREQTTQIFANIRQVLAAAGITPEQIVKTTVFLQDMSLFGEMNEVYASQFNGSYPARSAFAVKGLPKNALVEIEVIAMR
jgi:2-iminobutanoate/2-iminopropanoate deaminase